MSTEFAEVLAALPGEGYEIMNRLKWTHEQTYKVLVRLYDRGLIRLMPRDSKHQGTSRRIWESAEDQ